MGKEKKKEKAEYIKYWGVKILAWLMELRLVVDIIIWLLATANWQRISWINLFVLSCCCLVLAHTNLD